MSENVCILKENGTVKGFMDRKQVHNQGILHSAIQCWLINSKGEVLIQRRAQTKEQSAGKWDVSFGGHCVQCKNKDILLNNLIKEAQEELGLVVNTNEVIKLGEVRYVSQQGKNKELLAVFLIHVPDNQTFTFCDGEVCEVQWIKPQVLRQKIIENPQKYANRLPALTLFDFY